MELEWFQEWWLGQFLGLGRPIGFTDLANKCSDTCDSAHNYQDPEHGAAVKNCIPTITLILVTDL